MGKKRNFFPERRFFDRQTGQGRPAIIPPRPKKKLFLVLIAPLQALGADSITVPLATAGAAARYAKPQILFTTDLAATFGRGGRFFLFGRPLFGRFRLGGGGFGCGPAFSPQGERQHKQGNKNRNGSSHKSSCFLKQD
ncbi:MAG: hypothetical protein JXB25_00690 [Deltaproteobacteria bacterium]|nr:hypothetical protein [Deltaproteobacteria bacterium]